MEAERFWSKVDVAGPEDCWVWRGRRDHGGYGAAKNNGKQMAAHRLAWLIQNGPIPEDRNVCHHCDNPPCCNPSHLFICTQLENVRDCYAKGRRADQKDHRRSLSVCADCRSVFRPGIDGASFLICGRCYADVQPMPEGIVWTQGVGELREEATLQVSEAMKQEALL